MIVAIITVAIVMMLLITAVLAIAFVRYYKINKTKISLKESLDLINLPLITMENNGVKLNFLLDSGGNLSIISKSILDSLDYAIITDYETRTTSFDGSVEVSNGCGMCIYYKDIKFVEIFSMSDNDIIFNEIKKESGIQIHGILGNKFMRNYKYVLDFGDQCCYQKKPLWKK